LVNATRLVFGFHGVKERSNYFFREDQVQTVPDFFCEKSFEKPLVSGLIF
jgi:hypothetical protein